MKSPLCSPIRPWLLLALLGLPVAQADFTLETRVTPIPGAFRYEITVHNNDPSELALVSFSDAPLSDPWIDSTLETPVGFLASYDGGLGFVDFLADTGSFFSGSDITGFRFESLADPSLFFTQVEALDLQGNIVAGTVDLTVVPETGTTGAALLVIGVVATSLRRRRQTSQS